MDELKHIALADDHVIIRNGLKELIEKIGPYKVSAQYNNGEELLKELGKTTHPDLVILDLSMPEMDGYATLEQFKTQNIKVPVLILTLNEDETSIIKLFRLGARGYLLKNCSTLELQQALEDILSRGFYHNDFLTLSLQQESKPQKKSEQEQVLEELSPREREFLKLVCHEKEYTYGQIADMMGVHTRTVDGYRESLFSKFNIKSKTGLVLFVLKHHLFENL